MHLFLEHLMVNLLSFCNDLSVFNRVKMGWLARREKREILVFL